MEFTTANEASDTGGVKALVYSKSGIGKTVLAATAPKPLLISAESGLLSLRKANLEKIFGVNTPGIDYDVKVIKVSNVEDLKQAHAWCKANAYSAGFLTIGLDSISEIVEVILANLKPQHKDPRKAYGDMIDQATNLIREFRDLPKLNVYFSAKEEASKDEVTGVTTFGPSVPGNKLGQSLPYFFDLVMRLGVNKDQQGQTYRFLQTQPDLQYQAKDRSGRLEPVEYPHLGSIFNKIMAA